jgi:hypothetical protein
MRTCEACGYPNDTRFALCSWCWETLIAGNAAQLLGECACFGVVDRARAMRAAAFVARAVEQRRCERAW